MNRNQMLDGLHRLDALGIYVFARGDIAKMFPGEGAKALAKSLERMVAAGLIVRACNGVYVNPQARARCGWIIEDIALVLRRGCFSYVSLESALSEYGMISQMPMRLTVMTKGREGVYETPYGTIEFTHTRRGVADVLDRTILVPGRPLRLATRRAAVQDLRRVGRNVTMLDEEELALLDGEQPENLAA